MRDKAEAFARALARADSALIDLRALRQEVIALDDLGVSPDKVLASLMALLDDTDLLPQHIFEL